MNVNEAIMTIIDNWRDRSTDTQCREAINYLRSLESSPQWLRHEGGAMPEGVREETCLLVWYDGNSIPWCDMAVLCDWTRPLCYMVIPAKQPAPPKKVDKWRVTTGRTGSVLHKNDKHVCGLSCFTPAEQMAIVDALNKQAQGGGE